MGQLNERLRSVEGCHFAFWCPGCEEMHLVGTTWQWDGNLEAPTVSPSLLITSGHYCSRWKPGDSCWCTYNAEHADDPAGFVCERCHTFIKNGEIEFLPDCSHALAGKTLPIPPLPEDHRDPA